MAAPCLNRLDEAIASTRDELDRGYLLAEKGCYLARVGEHSAAAAIRDELRRGFGKDRDLKMSVLVMVLEGLMSYFQSLGEDARDRMARAQLLSRAADSRELTALTSAWLAHIEYNQGALLAALENVQLSIDSIENGQWLVLSRISSVLGDFFTANGDSVSARAWYSHARNAAVKYGDQAALGAIAYNQSAFRIFDLRLKRAVGMPVDPQSLELADAESRSASNYQLVAGVSALGHLLKSVSVSVAILRDQHQQALVLLSELFSENQIPASYSYRAVLLADAVLCCVKLGLPSKAKEYFTELAESELDQLPLDDQIIVFWDLNCAFSQAPELFSSIYSTRNISELAELLERQRAVHTSHLVRFKAIPAALNW